MGNSSAARAEGRPLRSMTGFGHADRSAQGVRLHVEIKTVNHRFLDLSLKLPRVYAALEGEVRARVQSVIDRGRVEILVTRVREERRSDEVRFDKPLFEALFGLQQQALRDLGLAQALSLQEETSVKVRLATDLLRRSDILEIPEDTDVESFEKALLEETLGASLQLVVSMQRAEGASLAADLALRLGRLGALKASIEGRAGEVHSNLRSKLVERVRKLAPEVQLDEARVAAEVVMLSDRSDITEELVRLGSHLAQFSKALNEDPSGKRFDFLLQEIHREFNTIGSKAQDAALQQSIVEAKIEIEKLREQVQNVA